MRFKTATSPHLPPSNSVSKVMRHVAIGLIPGTIAMVWFFGWGVIFNIISCIFWGYVFEGLALTLRGRQVKKYLSDNSALVTACLLALALPPFAPWWLSMLGMFFAIVIAKQLYGGLGYNPFNPAMVGYVVLLISFPTTMTTLWASPLTLAGDMASFFEALQIFLFGSHQVLDSVTSATPLDLVKIGLKNSEVIADIRNHDNFGLFQGAGWEFVNLGFLIGGIWMLKKSLIRWQIPTGVVIGLGVIALIFFALDSSTHPSPLFHLFSGGTMLGIFFIATDPVSGSTTPKGRIIYGLGIGIITYVIRTWGGYPDGFAFAVLVMNMLSPTIDHYTQPRVFGHRSD